MAQPKLFLLDAMALIYRAHFAFIKNPRITSKGVNTSAAFGFTNTLLEVLEKEKPSHLGVAFESEEPTHREELYAEYKAQRQPAPEELIAAIPVVMRILRAWGIPILQYSKYEADDVIGTMAFKAAERGFQVYIMSMDKDLAQLVNENIFLYRPGVAGNAHEVYDEKRVIEKYGVTPAQVPDLLGLKGDASDNIPGIPRVGDKTAIELLQQFGTLEAVLERADEIKKNALRESVKANAEIGRFSKALATIPTDLPIAFDEEALRTTPPDAEALEQVFLELEFKTLAKRVLGANPKPEAADLFSQPAPPKKEKKTFAERIEQEKTAEAATTALATIATRQHSYQTVSTPAERAQVIATLAQCTQFCFDTETTGLDAMTADIVGLALSVQPHQAWFVTMPEDYHEAQAVLEEFADVFANEKIGKLGQNMKYDLALLRRYGIVVNGPLFDTMLAHFVVQSDGKHSMDALARKYLHYDPVTIETLIGKKGKGQLSMRDVDTAQITEYAGEDADITLALAQLLQPELDRVAGRKLFEQVEMPLVPVLLDMEWQGVRIDADFLSDYSLQLEKELHQLERKIYALGGEFNINSPKQLGEVLFDKLKLGGKPKLTPTGQYATDEDTLSQLAHEHELPALILDYRQLTKLRGTYVDALPQLVSPDTGRVHTSFNQAVAITGRLSSNNPNLQNIPIRTERGREVRRAFIPRDEHHLLLSADYSQIELRVMAHMSGDEGLRQAFLNNEDIHVTTAAKVFSIATSEVTSDQRRIAKTANFGIIYGITPFGLAQRLGLERGFAKQIIDNYFEQYPGVRQFMQDAQARARETGYAETLMGRRHHLPNITSRNAVVRQFAERNAINTPLQGTAAEMIKLAMIAIHKALNKSKLNAKMILQVHDELLFDVPKKEVDELKALIVPLMENALPLSIPVEVGVGVGDNWLDAH